MKYLPNFITVFRIACSLIILFIKPLSPLFFTIYIAGGLSDIADGVIARKFALVSRAGAILDSIADAVLLGVLMAVFIPLLDFPAWSLWTAAIVLLLRIFSLVTGYVRYRAFASLHTIMNKAAGLALFCFPILYKLLGMDLTAGLLCVLTIVSAIEELWINFTSSRLELDRKSVFSANIEKD